MRKLGRYFGKGQCSAKSDHSAQHPNDQNQSFGWKITRNFGRCLEDSRPDTRSDGDHCQTVKADFLFSVFFHKTLDRIGRGPGFAEELIFCGGVMSKVVERDNM